MSAEPNPLRVRLDALYGSLRTLAGGRHPDPRVMSEEMKTSVVGLPDYADGRWDTTAVLVSIRAVYLWGAIVYREPSSPTVEEFLEVSDAANVIAESSSEHWGQGPGRRKVEVRDPMDSRMMVCGAEMTLRDAVIVGYVLRLSEAKSDIDEARPMLARVIDL